MPQQESKRRTDLKRKAITCMEVLTALVYELGDGQMPEARGPEHDGPYRSMIDEFIENSIVLRESLLIAAFDAHYLPEGELAEWEQLVERVQQRLTQILGSTKKMHPESTLQAPPPGTDPSLN
jgi:hypothetical protein